jgi:hypothetical protein
MSVLSKLYKFTLSQFKALSYTTVSWNVQRHSHNIQVFYNVTYVIASIKKEIKRETKKERLKNKATCKKDKVIF